MPLDYIRTPRIGRGGNSLSALLSAIGSRPAALYDFTSPANLFRDAAGTSPITADGQFIGRANDMTGRGNHAVQATEASQPRWQIGANGAGYALADGLDDGMQSLAALNPLGANNVMFFAAVRKLSNVNAAITIESGPNITVVNGTWGLSAPISPNTINYSARARGTVVASATTPASYSAPISNVVVGIANISAPLLETFVNGTLQSVTSANLGTGPFTSQILNLFRRNSATLAFSGWGWKIGVIYSSTAFATSDRIAAENWLRDGTGIY